MTAGQDRPGHRAPMEGQVIPLLVPNRPVPVDVIPPVRRDTRRCGAEFDQAGAAADGAGRPAMAVGPESFAADAGHVSASAGNRWVR